APALATAREAEIDRRLPFAGNFVLRHDAYLIQSVPEPQFEHAVLVRLHDAAIVSDAGNDRRRPGLVLQFVQYGLNEVRLVLRQAVPEVFDGVCHCSACQFICRLMRAPAASRRAISRKPSCLISCSHWPPDGSLSVLVGRHGAMKPAETVRCNMTR